MPPRLKPEEREASDKERAARKQEEATKKATAAKTATCLIEPAFGPQCSKLVNGGKCPVGGDMDKCVNPKNPNKEVSK